MKNYSTQNLKGLGPKQLRDFVSKYYQNNVQGKSVKNKDKGITIVFDKTGRNKTARSTFNKIRTVVVMDIYNVMSEAIYSNFNLPKPSHVRNYKAVGILNFKYKCKVDGKLLSVRLSVIQTKDLKFQYSLTFDKNI